MSILFKRRMTKELANHGECMVPYASGEKERKSIQIYQYYTEKTGDKNKQIYKVVLYASTFTQLFWIQSIYGCVWKII